MTALRTGREQRLGPAGVGAMSLVGCTVALVIAGALALAMKQPLVFPSLGPLLMLAFEQPLARASSPRSTLVGHGVAILVGWLALVLAGLKNAPSTLEAGFTWPRVIATAGSLGVVAGVLRLLRSEHPPAGATVLLVTLGLLSSPHQLLMVGLGVVVATALAWSINLALGQPVRFVPSAPEDAPAQDGSP